MLLLQTKLYNEFYTKTSWHTRQTFNAPNLTLRLNVYSTKHLYTELQLLNLFSEQYQMIIIKLNNLLLFYSYCCCCLFPFFFFFFFVFLFVLNKTDKIAGCNNDNRSIAMLCFFFFFCPLPPFSPNVPMPVRYRFLWHTAHCLSQLNFFKLVVKNGYRKYFEEKEERSIDMPCHFFFFGFLLLLCSWTNKGGFLHQIFACKNTTWSKPITVGINNYLNIKQGHTTME